jgi:cell division protein FtsB
MQKVKEAEPARAKSKGKAKAKVVNEVIEEARRERLEKLRAKRAVIQNLIDKLESQVVI